MTKIRLTHPLAIAAFFGALAVAGSVVTSGLAWPALGLIAGFATSGSV